jgi:hypothetical protein
MAASLFGPVESLIGALEHVCRGDHTRQSRDIPAASRGDPGVATRHSFVVDVHRRVGRPPDQIRTR